MKRVLVTGATGFTARYAIPELERSGFEVWGVSRSIEPGPRSLRADVTDPRSIEEAVRRAQPTHVLHLAGTPNLPDSERETLYRVNVDGTRNLLEACARLPERLERILVASSGYVYGDTGDSPATEDRTPAPVGEYGKSKLEMEHAAMAWRDRLSAVVARPFNYTGVGHGERFLVPKLVRAFKDRWKTIDFLDLELVRDFSDVRSIAEAYALLLATPGAQGFWNICSGRGTRLADLAERLAGLSGHRPVISDSTSVKSPIRVLRGSNAKTDAMPGRPSMRRLEETLSWMMNA